MTMTVESALLRAPAGGRGSMRPKIPAADSASIGDHRRSLFGFFSLGRFACGKTLASVMVILPVILACGCHAPPAIEKNANTEQMSVMLPVLAHMVEGADKTGALVRFVDLRSPEIERLKELCGPRFQIYSADECESTAGILRLKGSNLEGVHLVVEVTRLRGGMAQASGTFVHVGSFAIFRYSLRQTDGAWRISSCEFCAAS